MKQPIETYFQIGTIQWMSYPPADYSLLESVKKLASDEFFTTLEVTHVEADEERCVMGPSQDSSATG